MSINIEKDIWDYAYGNFNYVSSNDSEIYLGNILLDECFDLQYSYREMKEPVYGYRSKYFNAVLPGTVIISGQFTINYIHDAYLYSIINGEEMLSGPNATQLELDKIKDDMGKMNINPSSLVDGFAYKTTLQQYNDMRKLLDSKAAQASKIDSQLQILNAQLKDIQDKATLLEDKGVSDVNSIQTQKGSLVASWYGTEDSRGERLLNAVNNVEMMKEATSIYSVNNSIINDLNSANISNLDSALRASEFEHLVQEYEAKESSGLTDGEKILIENAYLGCIQALRERNEEYIRQAEETTVQPSLFNSDAKDLLTYDTAIEASQFNNKIALKTLEVKKEEIRARISKLKSDSKEIEKIKNALDGLKERLRDPSNFSFLTSTSGNFKNPNTLEAIRSGKLNNIKISTTRAEDHKAGLRIILKFNSRPHQVIEGIHLTGHTKMISAGTGQNLQESYTFFANKISTL